MQVVPAMSPQSAVLRQALPYSGGNFEMAAVPPPEPVGVEPVPPPVFVVSGVIGALVMQAPLGASHVDSTVQSRSLAQRALSPQAERIQTTKGMRMREFMRSQISSLRPVWRPMAPRS